MEIRELSAEEYNLVFQNWGTVIFDRNHPVLHPARTRTEEDARSQRKRQFEDSVWTLRLGAYVNGRLAGWSYSQQSGPDTVHMMISAVLPEFRRQGIYSRLLDSVVERVQQEGYEILTSNHDPANSAVLIAKLKAGFVITGYSVIDIVGPQVTLSRYLHANRNRALKFRLGHAFADEDILKRMREPSSGV